MSTHEEYIVEVGGSGRRAARQAHMNDISEMSGIAPDKQSITFLRRSQGLIQPRYCCLSHCR